MFVVMPDAAAFCTYETEVFNCWDVVFHRTPEVDAVIERLRAAEPKSNATSWYPVRIEFEDVTWLPELADTTHDLRSLTADRLISVETSDRAAMEAQFTGPVVEGTGAELTGDVYEQLVALSEEHRAEFGPILVSAMGPDSGYWVTSFMPLTDDQRHTFVTALDGPITFIDFADASP